VELHPLPSLTLSDGQFLTGDRAGGRPVTVTGEFRIAQGSGRLPVVVLMHGSSGMGPNIRMWADQLNAMGISTFALDGMTGRGLTTVGADQASLGRLNFILDIYAALELLAKHPRVDPARIALMGFSRGGQAALYASLERFHRLWNRSGDAGFAAYVTFYPDCATAYREDTGVVAAPIRILHGTADDYNPLATCRAYAGRLREAGRDVEVTEYPGAHHGFDSPFGPVPAAVSSGSQTVRACTIREAEPGVLVNAATGQPFTYQDACVQRNPHVGPDAEARAAAQRAVGDIFRTLFALR
jgi:dienelactone hydrolase